MVEGAGVPDEAALDTAAACRHAQRWTDAWNARDVDAIVGLYGDAVLCTSPTIARRWRRRDGSLRGLTALRAHVVRGLDLAPNLEFSLEDVCSGVDGYAAVYRRETGNRAVEVVRLDADLRIAEARAYYATYQP